MDIKPNPKFNNTKVVTTTALTKSEVNWSEYDELMVRYLTWLGNEATTKKEKDTNNPYITELVNTRKLVELPSFDGVKKSIHPTSKVARILSDGTEETFDVTLRFPFRDKKGKFHGKTIVSRWNGQKLVIAQ